MKYPKRLLRSAIVDEMKHYGYLLMMAVVVMVFTTGCSKDEGENDGEEEESGGVYIPETVTGKTFTIEGHMFYVNFLTETTCKVVPQYEWQTITSSSYAYKAEKDNKASLTLSYKDKITMGTSYTSSETTYELTLEFNGKGKGVLKGGCKSYITVNNGLGSVTKRYTSENLDDKAFTLN